MCPLAEPRLFRSARSSRRQDVRPRGSAGTTASRSARRRWFRRSGPLPQERSPSPLPSGLRRRARSRETRCRASTWSSASIRLDQAGATKRLGKPFSVSRRDGRFDGAWRFRSATGRLGPYRVVVQLHDRVSDARATAGGRSPSPTSRMPPDAHLLQHPDRRDRGLRSRASAGRVGLATRAAPPSTTSRHIGNFRTYVWEDLLRATLKYLGFARDPGDEHHRHRRQDHHEGAWSRASTPVRDHRAVSSPRSSRTSTVSGIERAGAIPRGRPEHIPEMIAHRARRSRGRADLRQPGIVCTSGSTRSGPTAASRISRTARSRSARAWTATSTTRTTRATSCLWKGHKDGEPSWDSPYGPGRLAWHLECSRDEHRSTSGRASTSTPAAWTTSSRTTRTRSRRARGRPGHPVRQVLDARRPPDGRTARRWRSRRGTSTIRDLIARGHDPRVIRYLLLTTHYRTSLNLRSTGWRARPASWRASTFVRPPRRGEAGAGAATLRSTPRSRRSRRGARRLRRRSQRQQRDGRHCSARSGEANAALDKNELPADSAGPPGDVGRTRTASSACSSRRPRSFWALRSKR